MQSLCFLVAVVNVHFHWTCSGVTLPASSPAFIVCRLVRMASLTGGIWFPIVVSIGVPAAIRDAVHLLLWWRFACFPPCFLYIKGCEENLLWQLASWNSVVFGIYFCNPHPGRFPEGSCQQKPQALWIRGAGQPFWSSCSYRKCLQATALFKTHLWFLRKSASWAVD